MAKINQLPPNVFNMLAAGEVVERPASVVKELIENAIDAGATSIDVYIEEGGKRKISVADNGIGIAKDDLRAAFLPHATSKIQNITDLDSLSTLGFRGEALASIASVSEVTMISSYHGSAARIALSGGQVIDERPDSRDVGTVVTVENLFFNTPARLKFLKKDAGEQRAVLEVVQAQILANPAIAFSLECEEGTLLTHAGGSLYDAIISVYGVSCAERLLPIEQSAEKDIRVGGYTSSADFTKPNRTYQTVIVNGRSVKDVAVQTAVEKAYGSFLMKRAYPMFVLDIIMPFDDVDVNVHPSKTEVRFADKQAVFSAVYHAVADVVSNSVQGGSFGFDIGDGSPTSSANTESENALKDELKSQIHADFGEAEGEQLRLDFSALRRMSPPRYSGLKEGISYYNDNFDSHNDDNPARDNKNISEHFPASGDFYKSATRNANDKFSASDWTNSKKSTQNRFDNDKYERYTDDEQPEVFDGKIIGQAFSTYILVERDNVLYVIDQHAAHERILYDSIVAKLSVEFSQPLLIPYKLNLTPEEEDYFEQLLPKLIEMGFEIKRLSAGWYLIIAVPQPVSGVNFPTFFGSLFENMQSADNITLAELLKDKLAQQACKAAIKGGEALNLDQIQRVIKNFTDESGALPAKCPHGRPAVIAFTKTDFEKMFKRIV